MNNTIINSIMRNIVKYLCAVLLVIGTSAHAWGTTCTLYGGVNGNTVLGSITNGQSIPACNTNVTGWDILTSGVNTVWTTSKYSASNPTTDWPDSKYTKYSSQTLPDGITALYAVYAHTCDDGYYYSGNPYECYGMTLTPASGPTGRAYRANSSGTELYDYCFIAPGTTVYIKAEPTGENAQSCTVLDGSSNELTVTKVSTNFFSFTMPSSDVIAEVVFVCPDLSQETLTVTATDITSTGVELSWDIDGADKYDLWLKSGSSFDGGTLVSSGSDRTYTSQTISSALTPNTHYWFRVRAENNCGATTKTTTIDFWTLQRYTITYNGNGGTVSPTSVYADYGSDIVLPNASAGTHSGYNLTKWRLNNASSGTQYNLGGSYTNVTANATFYAQWTPISYTITYNNLNGATNSNPTSYNIESANITLVNPGTRTGYTFAGWYTNSGLTTAASTPAIATGSTGDKTFYAKWTQNDVAITLEANGGVADGAATVKYDGTSATITTAVTHATKTLKGYYTAASDGTKVLESDGSFAATSIDGYITAGKWTKADATTLHAQWLTVEKTVTFDLDGKGENFTRKVENGTPVGKPTPDPTNADYNFVKWVTTDGGNTEFDFTQNITADVTVYSKWEQKSYQNRIFACVDISVGLEEVDAVPQKVLITSRNGMNIIGARKLLVTVSGALAGHTVSITSAGGLKFYQLKDSKYVELTGAANVLRAPLTNKEVYVSYNPTTDGNGSITAPTFTIACDGESREFNTGSEYVKVRNLPDAVAIVANVGGSWHGLSANITSSSTPKDQMVAVAEADGLLKAYAPTTEFGYKLWPVKSTHSSDDRSGYTYTSGTPAKLYGDRLRFAGKDEKGLWANDLGESSNSKYNINNTGTINAISSSFTNDENYEWKVTTREVDGQFVYTLQTDQTNNKRYLRLWSGRWGTYQDGRGTEDVYLLPIVETALVDMKPFEWGTDQVVVSYTPEATPVALTGVNLGSDAAASPTFTQLGSSDLWRVSGLTGMTGKPAQQLQVMITENGVAKQGLLQIPLIVSGNSTEAALRESLTGANATERNKVAKNTDVVILNGGTLTTGTASGNFKDLYIYAGGKLNNTDAMSFGDMYMRGGFGYIGAETWDVPRAKIDAAVSLSGKLYYDLTMDATKYYDLAVPYEVDLNEATDDKGDGNFNVWMKVYDGTLRANTGKGWTWYNWSGDLLLHPGTGYLIEATPRYNRSYCTVRFPMSPDLSSGETAKSAVDVTAPGMNVDGTIATGKTPNNVGWNFIANPFMCNFGASLEESSDGVLQLGELVEHENAETHKWDGTYDWDATGAKKIRYVTTFNYNSQEYAQHPLSTETLKPFTGFFVQVAKAGAINFATGGRLAAPTLLRNTSMPSDMEVAILLSGNGKSDETRLHLNDELELANPLEFPDETTKQINDGALNFYTFAGSTSMYANGMSFAESENWNDAGMMIPANGEYTFSVGEVNENYVRGVMLLDKETGFEYNLLDNDAIIELQTGTLDERFAIKLVYGPHTTTGIDEASSALDAEGAQKFIWQDMLYIRTNGILYDATGKRVKEINK